MSRSSYKFHARERGAILVVALLFLVAITLLTVSSMQSSNLGLMMSQNEESRMVAEQGAQAIADFVISNPATTPVTGTVGFTICTPNVAGCDRNDLPIDQPVLASGVAADELSARVQRMAPALRPPPRLVGSSVDKFSSASFTVTSTYDRSEDSLGRQQITEGVMVLVPTL